MTHDIKSLPSSEENENAAEPRLKKKSFVRIAARKKKAPTREAKPLNAKAGLRPEILEAEIVEIESIGKSKLVPTKRTEQKGHALRSHDVIDVSDLNRSERARNDGRDEDWPLENPDSGEFEEVTSDFDESALSKEKSLVFSNGLQRYLAELRRYPLLTIEEERSVATEAHERNDVVARNRLVTANLRLVVKIAMEYRRNYSHILDLIQEGNAGLVQAVNRFNPYRGVKLSTYSAWWIRAYILKFLMDNKSLVRMGTTDAQRKLFFRLRSEAEKMYALTQRFDANLLAESIGVKPSDVIEMQQRLTKNDVSLDAPVRDDNETRQIDNLAAEIEEPDVAIQREQVLSLLRSEVSEVEKELNERDAYIFKFRIMAEDPITLQDVGDKFQITRERARQLESRVLKKIKERLLAAGIQK